MYPRAFSRYADGAGPWVGLNCSGALLLPTLCVRSLRGTSREKTRQFSKGPSVFCDKGEGLATLTECEC